METCPACKLGLLKSTDLAVTLPTVLRRWEEVLHHPFPKVVWDEYQRWENQPVLLVECTACGFGRFEPVVPGTEAFYESISSANYYNDDKWEFACAAADLKTLDAKRVLDVGCGSGLFLEYLRQRIPQVELFGFDVNAELLAKLAGRGFGILRNDRVCAKDEPTEEARFDAISMLQVLEHASDPIAFLASFVRFLRPGGSLIVTTPNSAGPVRRFSDALTELPPHHVTRWTENSLRALLPKHGVSIRSVRFEPLPDYLWDAYLPKLWEEPIWPALLFDPLARERGLGSVGERAGMAARAMKDAGIRWLYGVPGHTIYVRGCLTGTDE